MTGRGLATSVSLAIVAACAAEPPRPERAPPVVASSAPVTAPVPALPVRTLLGAARPHFPPPGASGVCPDAVLSLAVSGAVSLGASGAIRVLDVESGAVVDELELGSAGHSDVIGGRTFRIASP
ncbi:MAG TPA: hypothetical protein VFZ53_23855, partial [Polyangiaceae bacterium]